MNANDDPNADEPVEGAHEGPQAEKPPDQSHRGLERALALLDELRSQERYGDSTVAYFGRGPQRADGCVLDDGARANVRCVASPPPAPDDDDKIDPTQCVWQRPLSGSQLARRGRLVVDQSGCLRFVDDPHAGDHWGPKEQPPSLERDLATSARVMELCRSDVFVRLLYAALCNTTWRHDATGQDWHCSWRHAGGVLAHIRGKGEYLDWYCSGDEGMVDEAVLVEIEKLGWSLVAEEPYPMEDEW